MSEIEPVIDSATLRSRLLGCMRHVLLLDVALKGELPPPFHITYRDALDNQSGIDVVLLREPSLLDAVRDYLSPNSAVYIVHGDEPPALAPHNLAAYVQWPGMTMAVSTAYDPVVHAHALLKQGRPHEAHEVLMNVPLEMLRDANARVAHAAEMQWCLLASATAAGLREALNLFFRAQEQFFIATTFAPYYAPSYLCHAKHWQLLGRDDMARRLLRTCQTVSPLAQVVEALRSIPERAAPQYDVAAPEVAVAPGSRRLLIVCHEGSDYGLDTLYDGLCEVLGDDAVVELPWKPTLHGQEPERAEGYPCVYHRAGEPRPLGDIESELRAGAFDAVLYADTLMTLDRQGVRQLMQAAGETPLFLIDTWDEGGNYRDDLLAFLGRDSCHGCFKREMLAGVDYGPDTFPLPFAYTAEPGASARQPRDRDLFWAGKPAAGLRPVYLQYLQSTWKVDVERRYSQAEYKDALRRSRIGINLFGYGFDTVRYWEVPAHGAMLLSERPPTCIPHNFVDGVHAVFFDDLPDLDAKLDYYMNHPDEAASIAAAGHEHFKRYHTAEARARQFLGVVAMVLG